MIALSLGDRYSYRSRNIEIMKSLSAIGELMKTTLALDSQIKKIVDSWGSFRYQLFAKILKMILIFINIFSYENFIRAKSTKNLCLY